MTSKLVMQAVFGDVVRDWLVEGERYGIDAGYIRHRYFENIRSNLKGVRVLLIQRDEAGNEVPA